jgi:hypothetical protein
MMHLRGFRRLRTIAGSAVAFLLLGWLTLGSASAAPRPLIADNPRPLIADNPIGMNPMLTLAGPFGAEQAMLSQAAAGGASTVRLDIELTRVFPGAPQPDWASLNQYISLARTYHLRVLGLLDTLPAYMVVCPPGTPQNIVPRCPVSNMSLWAQEVGEIAAHTRGTINEFEILNEPNGQWSFIGSPQQYAAMLSAAYRAIHGANPVAQVLLGGVALGGHRQLGATSWMDQVLTTPGADALHSFDIANIHVRATAKRVGGIVCGWRQYFASRGFRGPVWVTETGYPANPAYPNDPAYTGGAASQAAFLRAAITNMVGAGAGKVFVTERDLSIGRWESEGLLQSPDPLPANPSVVRRPSFYTIKQLAKKHWPSAARTAGCPTQ